MISIVTVTYNRSLQMIRGLSSLARLVSGAEFIIIDDGSNDGTKSAAEVLADRFKNNSWTYQYLDNPEPRISCIPRNIGWKQARGNIIVFTESECLHISGIEKLIAKLQETEQTPVATQVWTMGEKIYKDLDESYFQHPDTILRHNFAMMVDGNMQNTKAPDSDWGITGSAPCVVGCLFAVRREWMNQIGGFDESFEGHGWDDFDLFNRLSMIGHGIVHCNDIPVIHQWHEKHYPYNIYEMADRNGKKSEENVKKGVFKVNV